MTTANQTQSKSQNRESGLPPRGAMVLLSLNGIGDGDLTRRCNDALRTAIKDIDEAGGGKVTISPQIVISRIKGSSTGIEIKYKVSIKKPECADVQVVQDVDGKMLTNFSPVDGQDLNQQFMFDSFGRPVGVFDPTTGEVIEDQNEQSEGTIAKLG